MTSSSQPSIIANLISSAGLSSKEKRIIIAVAAGGAAWIGCCAAAYLAYRNHGRHDSFCSVSPQSFLGSKSQKSQFMINELRKVTEEMAALRTDVNGVKVLVKQLRRDIAELRCLERNGAVTFPVGNFLQPSGSNEHLHPTENGVLFAGEPDGYNEDDESDFEFRSARSEIFDVASRIKPSLRSSSQRIITSTPSSDLGRDRLASSMPVSVSDSDVRNHSRTKRSSSESIAPLVLSEIDAKLDGRNKSVIRDTLRLLEDLYSRHRNNPDIMWRLGRALYYELEWLKVNEPNNAVQRRDIAYRAKDICFEALSRLSDPSATVYKWCALVLGNLQPFETVSNRIKQGYEFRTLIEKAIEIDPNDPLCHYLLGRWFYGCYELTWYERKIAATLFATPPSATVDEALGEFLKCNELLAASNQTDWKENCLQIAKCYIEKRDTTGEIVRWLKAGECLPDVNDESKPAGEEIARLLAQYS